MNVSKKIVSVCAIVAILAILFFVIPFPTTEVYETTETYYETEPYQEQVLMQYQIIDPTDLTRHWNITLGYYDVGRVTVRNTDTEGGSFAVTYKFRNVYGVAKQETKSYFIGSGASYTFEFVYDSEMGEDVTGEYSISEPYKTVTRYHQVPKQRTVLKTRTVNKTLFQRLLG